MKQQRALTEIEAADYCSVSRSLLRKSRTEGERENRLSGPPWIKMGKRAVRYLKEDLDAWLESFPKMEPNKSPSEES